MIRWYWRSPMLWWARWLHLFLGIVWRRIDSRIPDRLSARTAAQVASIMEGPGR